jgi:flagellar biosynthesis protein FliR
MDITSVIIDLKTNGFIDYFVTFVLIFAATYYLFLTIPLFNKDAKRKKVATLISLAVAFIFISNDRYIEALHTTVEDYSYVIVMVILIALIVASILYIAANYHEKNGE